MIENLLASIPCGPSDVRHGYSFENLLESIPCGPSGVRHGCSFEKLLESIPSSQLDSIITLQPSPGVAANLSHAQSLSGPAPAFQPA